MKKFMAVLFVVVVVLPLGSALGQNVPIVLMEQGTPAGIGEEVELGGIGTIMVDSFIVKDSIAEMLSGNRNKFLVVHASFFNMTGDTLLLRDVLNARLDYDGKAQYDALYAADYADLLFGTWTGGRYENNAYQMLPWPRESGDSKVWEGMI